MQAARNKEITNSSPHFPAWSRFLKRSLDLAASILGLFFLSPVFGLIALVIKRSSPGPIFYRGPRMGRDGLLFRILKFRTMVESPESYLGPRITAEDDERITSFGRWLRATKINELPQLWNVLRGEMSLVGPRPEEPEIAARWAEADRREILSVRPGITSPASVLFRDEEKLLSTHRLMDVYLGEIQPSKLRLDQLYVRHHSLLLDLDVLFWTFLVVSLPRLRNHKLPEDALFVGLISRFVRRYFNWFMIDTCTTLIAFGLVGAYWRLFVGPLNLGLFTAILIAIAYSILVSSIAALTGVQKISWSSAFAVDALRLVLPIALAFLAAMVVNTWIPVLPGEVILDTAVLAFCGYVFTRYRSRLLTGPLSRWLALRKNSLIVRERVLIVGAGDAGQFAAWRLAHGQKGSGYQVMGFVDDDLYQQGMRIKGISILGKCEDIPGLVGKHDIGVIVFAIHNIPDSKRRDILKTCRDTGARLVTWPNMLSLIRPQPARDHSPALDGKPAPGSGNDALERKQVLRWLDALETELDQGDYAAIVEQINLMRSALQDHLLPNDLS
jgi:lipopolysaccharide/colanic/teichoic acid biosynthesis glycosyltransferase